jgi:hypothetical protein
MTERTDALVNGALISLGAAAIPDNVFSHWLFWLPWCPTGQLGDARRNLHSLSDLACDASSGAQAPPGERRAREEATTLRR